jgi:hypothetical protein
MSYIIRESLKYIDNDIPSLVVLKNLVEKKVEMLAEMTVRCKTNFLKFKIIHKTCGDAIRYLRQIKWGYFTNDSILYLATIVRKSPYLSSIFLIDPYSPFLTDPNAKLIIFFELIPKHIPIYISLSIYALDALNAINTVSSEVNFYSLVIDCGFGSEKTPEIKIHTGNLSVLDTKYHVKLLGDKTNLKKLRCKTITCKNQDFDYSTIEKLNAEFVVYGFYRFSLDPLECICTLFTFTDIKNLDRIYKLQVLKTDYLNVDNSFETFFKNLHTLSFARIKGETFTIPNSVKFLKVKESEASLKILKSNDDFNFLQELSIVVDESVLPYLWKLDSLKNFRDVKIEYFVVVSISTNLPEFNGFEKIKTNDLLHNRMVMI